MTRRRRERTVHGLVRQVQTERRLPRPLQPSHGVVGQQIGHVAFGLEVPAVLVQLRIDVLALARKAQPIIKAGARVRPRLHVPLAHKRRLVARPAKQLRKRRQRRVGVHGRVDPHPMRVCVRAGQERRPTRRAERRRHERVGEPRALPGQAVHVRRLNERMPEAAHRVPAHVVNKYENDVRPADGLGLDFGAFGRREQAPRGAYRRAGRRQAMQRLASCHL